MKQNSRAFIQIFRHNYRGFSLRFLITKEPKMTTMGQKESSLISYLPDHSTNAVYPLCGQQNPGSLDKGISKRNPACMELKSTD